MVALGADLALFLIGLAFASPSTVLPAFAAALGAPNVVIGAIPAVMTAGWFLPSLFVAGYTETLPRKLPFVLRYTVWERVPFAALALAAFFVAATRPGLAIALLLAMLLIITGVGGMLMPAWMDVIGRTIPTTLRGRFFATTNLIASVGGLAGSFLTAAILRSIPAPHGFGVCFLIATVFVGLSYIALAVTREPVATSPPAARSLRSYLRSIPGLLRRHRNFTWFLVARACGAVGGVTGAFYTVYALKALVAPAWQVGLFTALLFAGQIIGNLTFGWLSDRAGHRVVIIIGTVSITAANVLTLVAGSLEAFGFVFVLAGISGAAVNVSVQNVLLEFAPTVGERPTYIGVGNTAMAPVMFAAPLLAGVIADRQGFVPVFSLGALFGAVAVLLLVTRVREPRHASVI